MQYYCSSCTGSRPGAQTLFFNCHKMEQIAAGLTECCGLAYETDGPPQLGLVRLQREDGSQRQHHSVSHRLECQDSLCQPPSSFFRAQTIPRGQRATFSLKMKPAQMKWGTLSSAAETSSGLPSPYPLPHYTDALRGYNFSFLFLS